eukprot:m51a1_g14830 hypothetical protein (249) ;mRNA; f:687736-688643
MLAERRRVARVLLLRVLPAVVSVALVGGVVVVVGVALTTHATHRCAALFHVVSTELSVPCGPDAACRVVAIHVTESHPGPGAAPRECTRVASAGDVPWARAGDSGGGWAGCAFGANGTECTFGLAEPTFPSRAFACALGACMCLCVVVVAVAAVMHHSISTKEQRAEKARLKAERKRVEKETGERRRRAFALACGLHKRLGELSPLQMLDPFALRLLAEADRPRDPRQSEELSVSPPSSSVSDPASPV